jgi:OOP family OmpA-OmpF porin
MIRIKTLVVALLAMPLLAACTVGPDLTMTKRMASKGDAFNQALHREYLALAQSELDQGDTDSAVYYNDKATAAAKGDKVGPQAVKERKLPGDTKWELEAARQALRAAMGTKGILAAKPNLAAKAQAMFDCWMEQQEENDQPPHIAVCRDAFNEALKKLEARPKMMAKPKPAPKKKPVDQVFVIYFDHDSAALNPPGMKTVVDVRRLSSIKTAVVSGHTDTSGSSAYNEKLAEKRANVVAGALKASGIPEYKIFVEAFGEDDPAMATGDNVRETLNRRVTITVQ